MALAARYPLSIQQGGALDFVLTYTDKETGAPAVDLSIYSASLQIRKSMDEASPELELTSDAGEITFDDTTGQITSSFTKTQIDALSSSNREITSWVWGLQIWETADKDGTARLLVRGPLIISPSPVR